LDAIDFYGLLDSGIDDVTCLSTGKNLITDYEQTSKVRIYVGTDKYLNNLWDSGIVETSASSMYYGGGNNLIMGNTYYLNIQVYSDVYGWSEIQTKKWIM
jgi:hypothetical protein